jgi:hypothetical protein
MASGRVQMSTENPTIALRDKLTALAPSMEGSSLYLLRAIDETIDSLQAEERFAEAMAGAARRLEGEIRAAAVVTGCYLDSDDAAINQIEAGYRALEEYLPGLLVKKAAIDEDAQLDGDQCELLHTAYDRCTAALAALVEASKDLRAAVIGHDLAAEPPPAEVFDSSEALIASLRASSA